MDYRAKKGIKILPAGQISAEVRTWYNPYLKTRYFMVPAIVGLLLSIITLILTSLAVVKEKEIGTLEQIIVTPIKPFQLIIGKLVPFTILGFISVVLVITMMNILFSIPVRRQYNFSIYSFVLLHFIYFGFRTFCINNFKNSAAGNDDCNFRNYDADGLSLRFCVSN